MLFAVGEQYRVWIRSRKVRTAFDDKVNPLYLERIWDRLFSLHCHLDLKDFGLTISLTGA